MVVAVRRALRLDADVANFGRSLPRDRPMIRIAISPAAYAAIAATLPES